MYNNDRVETRSFTLKSAKNRPQQSYKSEPTLEQPGDIFNKTPSVYA